MAVSDSPLWRNDIVCNVGWSDICETNENVHNDIKITEIYQIDPFLFFSKCVW